MVREYIGARYVPKFMGTYDPTQIYEALCVVDNGSGTSYISKVPTPAGTPLTDTDYWAIYGASSGAIINLQNQIDDMNDGSVVGSLQNQINGIDSVVQSLVDDVSPLVNKKYLIIGDSYAVYNTPNFVDLLAGYLGLTINTDLFVSAASGYGFSNANGKFITLLNNAVVTDDDEITDIIVLGGVNDAFVLTDVETDIAAFIIAANLRFTNAKIHIGMLGGNTDLSIKNALPSVVIEYQKCAKYGAAYIANCEYIMCNQLLLTNDGTHPTATGTQYIAQSIANYMLNGTIEVRVPKTQATSTGLTTTLFYAISNELTTFWIGNLSNLPYNAVYANQWQTVTALSVLPFNGGGEVVYKTLCTFTSGANTYVYPIEFRFTNNMLEYKVTDTSGSTYQNVDKIYCTTMMVFDSMQY